MLKLCFNGYHFIIWNDNSNLFKFEIKQIWNYSLTNSTGGPDRDQDHQYYSLKRNFNINICIF